VRGQGAQTSQGAGSEEGSDVAQATQRGAIEGALGAGLPAGHSRAGAMVPGAGVRQVQMGEVQQSLLSGLQSAFWAGQLVRRLWLGAGA
jgi:hypothetical protein